MKYINLTVLSAIFALSSNNIQAYEDIPNEYFACYSNFNSMMVSPDGRHLLIINTVKDNVCDIEQDKVKQIEDEMSDRGLLLLDLDTMETTMLSDGSAESGINNAGWLNSNRIWYTPRYKTGQNIESRVTFAMNIDGTRRTIIKKGGYWGQSIYNYDYDDPNHVYVVTNERRSVIFDYYRLNIFTGKKTRLAYGPDIGDMKGKVLNSNYKFRFSLNHFSSLSI